MFVVVVEELRIRICSMSRFECFAYIIIYSTPGALFDELVLIVRDRFIYDVVHKWIVVAVPSHDCRYVLHHVFLELSDVSLGCDEVRIVGARSTPY